jgi:hypothetical protein
VGGGAGVGRRGRGAVGRDGGEEGTKLIDFAVGKGGDLNKFIQAGVSFVYGVDIAKDNIQNVMDGICARYLESHRVIGSNKIPWGVFQVGDCTRNLRKGEAFGTEKDRVISRGVYGQGAKNTAVLERMPLVKRVFGWGENGFEVGSCQFALHFFCENATKFHGFMQNLTENMKIGGVFVCTTFDGQRLFEKLRGVSEGDSWTLYGSGVHGGERIFQLTKRYAETGFPSDEMGLGYGVDVYQESINKTFREYLVHPEFLKSVMFDYGFTLVRREEAEQIGFERGTDTFDALHNSMLKEARFGGGGGGGNGRGGAVGEYGMAEKMSREEKEVSFLNRYYIFRKRHMVDAGEVLKQRRKRTQAEGVWMNRAVEDIGEITAPVSVSSPPDMDVAEDKKTEVKEKEKEKKFRKISKKVVLNNYSPVVEEEEVEIEEKSEKEMEVKETEKDVEEKGKKEMEKVVEEIEKVIEEKVVGKIPKKRAPRTTLKKNKP